MNISAIGTVLFGKYISNTEIADEFINHLLGFFTYLQPLMYGPPLYKLYPTKTWKAFEFNCDNLMDIGQVLVNKVSAISF